MSCVARSSNVFRLLWNHFFTTAVAPLMPRRLNQYCGSCSRDRSVGLIFLPSSGHPTRSAFEYAECRVSTASVLRLACWKLESYTPGISFCIPALCSLDSTAKTPNHGPALAVQSESLLSGSRQARSLHRMIFRKTSLPGPL